jgi:uncharacterized protein with PQ loop repeat
MELLKMTVERLYVVSGPLMFLAYFPQIITLWKNKDGARSTSLMTWFMWVLALSINTAYAAFVNGDRYFLLSTASSLTGTVLVFMIACYKRWYINRPLSSV